MILGVGIGLMFAGVSLVLSRHAWGSGATGEDDKDRSPRWFVGLVFAYRRSTDGSADLLNMTKMINGKGGLTIKGQKYDVEIITEDTKSAFDGCTAAANRLVFDKKASSSWDPVASLGQPQHHLQPQQGNVCPELRHHPARRTRGQYPYGFLASNASVGYAILAMKALKKEFPEHQKRSPHDAG